MSSKQLLHTAYEAVKSACASSYSDTATTVAIRHLADLSLKFLTTQSQQIALVSKVANKKYISFKANGAPARPANEALFMTSASAQKSAWTAYDKGSLSKPEILKLLYTAALAPCLAMELFDKQNKKGPATYFECFVGNMLATRFHRDPNKRATLKIGDAKVALTMDFLFPKVGTKSALHVPVKMSTRERVVQAWAHQAMLNSAFGSNTYAGVMILFSETKLDSRNLEVVEICVPDQWLAYQTHLARMEQIYYFDMPDRYLQMAAKHPKLFNLAPISELS